jgi:hypothetical protein
VVHQAVHSLATPPSSATSSPPPAAAVMTSLDTPPSPSDAHPSAVPSGSVAVDESLITLNAPARALFERVRPPAPLLVTFGSISMSEFVLNWVAHVQKLEGQGASHVDFAVAVLDKPLLALLDEKGLPAITLAAVDGLMEHKEYFRADEKKFLRMGEIKVDLIRPLIAAGYHVLMCDADVVIMSDPWPWVLPGLAREPAMRHRVAQMVRADVLVTTDCIDEQEDGQERHWLMNKEFNTGVLFFRGSRGALDVIDRVRPSLPMPQRRPSCLPAAPIAAAPSYTLPHRGLPARVTTTCAAPQLVPHPPRVTRSIGSAGMPGTR